MNETYHNTTALPVVLSGMHEAIPILQPIPSAPFIPLTDWPRYYTWPSVAGLRYLRFNCETNGFERAFITVGKRVLVDSNEFFAAVKRMNQKGGHYEKAS